MAEANLPVRSEVTTGWAGRRSASVAVALAGAVVGGGLYLGNQAYIAATSSAASCGAGCVTDGSVLLSAVPEMRKVEEDIATENRSVTSSGSYASVVLLDPFTYSTSGTVSQVRIIDELRGAYLAQLAANDQPGATRIQLLLANEGTSGEEGEVQAVRQIESLEGQDHIVAVAGMGLSTAPTQTAATDLAADGMPMFGALTTGDQFYGANYQGFYQVIPDVDAQVLKLQADLKVTKGQPVAIISSNQMTDIYSTDLQADFKTAFDSPALRYFSFDPTMASLQFATIATTICGPPGDPPVVLYAGREAALPTLVQQFQHSCDGKKVTIVTGSDANALPASATSTPQEPASATSTPRGLPIAMVTVEYSDIEDVAKVPPGFIKEYSLKFPSDSDIGFLPACPKQLYDPWTVATYNSVIAAVGALRDFRGPPTKETVFGNAVKSEGSMPYAGVADNFGFNVNGQLAAADIPVFQDKKGICSLVPAGA